MGWTNCMASVSSSFILRNIQKKKIESLFHALTEYATIFIWGLSFEKIA